MIFIFSIVVTIIHSTQKYKRRWISVRWWRQICEIIGEGYRNSGMVRLRRPRWHKSWRKRDYGGLEQMEIAERASDESHNKKKTNSYIVEILHTRMMMKRGLVNERPTHVSGGAEFEA